MMKILFYIIFICVVVVVSITTVYFLFSSKPSQGLGGIGYGIAIGYLTIIFIVLLIVLFFLSPTLKIFFQNISYLFIINIILVLILSLLKWYDGYIIEKQWKQNKIHEKKVNNYFEETKKNIHKNENIDSLLRKWNKELTSNIYEREQLLSIYFLSYFHNIDNNKLILEQKVNELFPLNLENKLWEKISKEEQKEHINEAFKMALDETNINNSNLIRNSCFIYSKFSILLNDSYDFFIKECNAKAKFPK